MACHWVEPRRTTMDADDAFGGMTTAWLGLPAMQLPPQA